MSKQLDKIIEANKRADPWADKLVAHVLNSPWTILYLAIYAIVFIVVGWQLRGWL